MLLDDMIAAEPREEVPVAELVLHLGQPGVGNGCLAGGPPFPIGPQAEQLADLAPSQPLDDIDVLWIVPAL